MTGSDALNEPAVPGRLRSIPSRIRRLATVDGRLVDLERRLATIEERLRSPELDGSALESVRDAVRELGIEVTEELNDLAAVRSGADARSGQG